MQGQQFGASLDDYLKLHSAPKPATTFAQKEPRQYDFSAVDRLDDQEEQPSENDIPNTNQSLSDASFNYSKMDKGPPRKELQAFCTAAPAQ